MTESVLVKHVSTVEFQVIALTKTVNDLWKVNAIESGHANRYYLTHKLGKKFIKLIRKETLSDATSVYAFVDKETGAVYKAASWNAPAKGIRFYISQLLQSPTTCDPYGSFLYVR